MRELFLPIIAILAVVCTASPDTLANPTSCPKVDPINSTVHLPHETDCTKYYKCSNGKKYVMDCPLYTPGHRLHFDPTLQVCVWPWETNCTTQASGCTIDGYKEPHPYNCSLFYTCKNGEKTLSRCANGLFDSKTLSCVSEASATCGTYLHDCPKRQLLDTVYLPHECKCGQYYECVDAEAIERRCKAGESFDSKSRKCVAAGDANCNTDQNRPTTVKCPSTGVKYIADETDCGSYYECRDGVSERMECNDGLSFDPVTSMCTWPPSVECSSETRTRSNARHHQEPIKGTTRVECPPVGLKRMPHECSCSIYYTCDEGKRIREECPEGLIYDYIMERCDNLQTAVCRNSESDYPFNSVKSLEILVGSPLAATGCPARGYERIPHESNCRYYYECSNGRKQLGKCLEGHYFNAVIESCDLPDNTNCRDKWIETTSSNPVATCTCPMESCGTVRCPNQKNCSEYYQCVNTIPVVKKCPDGLQYDPRNEICDYSWNVNCTVTPEPPKCPKGEKSHHECQCDQYYECDGNGRLEVKRCPAGLYFDYEKKICDVPENVQCWPPTDHTPAECEGKCTKDSMERLPHKDCNKYCQCKAGSATVVTCSANQVYDPNMKICDWPENVKDLTCDPFPCDIKANGTLLPNECYCDLYYECRSGSKIRKRCEDGTNFDYVKQRCVPCSSAHCYAKMEPKGDPDCKETCSARNASFAIEHNDCKKYCECNECSLQVVRECAVRQYFDPTKRQCDWPENIKDLSCDPFPCLPDGDENLPHECYCQHYYVCKNGKKYSAQCQDGYMFDYVSGTCVTFGAHCYKKPSKGNELGVELRCMME